ncbi:carbohydrate ABC transporter permease [Paenibacillus spongiae]|uniref:Carbohydrate ABC transporter permease n=1 Tax=Paenibacillus spongiae TaxID=2909671 RepID=A0ABY5S6J8_9BACL|nr:carbohydrate ABC transporter permease [Paenibacillus spongiae]UVI29529.1 carbohydrate ABC transporter permease [Paenibacillus spongiae]
MLLKKRLKKLYPLTVPDGLRLLFVTLYAIMSVIPIIYIFNTAFKPLSELFLYPPRFFVNNPSFHNFYDLFFALKLSVLPFSRYVFNSVVVTAITIIAAVVISTMGAYSLSRMRFPGKDWIFSVIIISLMFSPEAVKITRYLVVTKLGLMNSYSGHILPHLALPICIFLIKQFMDQIPRELSEAAKIDGASEWRIFATVVVPNVKPAIGTAAILTFQAVWGDTETSTYFMTDESMKTLPYFVQTMTGGLTTVVARQGASAAAGLLLFIPNLIIFVILQRCMINTLVNSGIK